MSVFSPSLRPFRGSVVPNFFRGWSGAASRLATALLAGLVLSAAVIYTVKWDAAREHLPGKMIGNRGRWRLMTINPVGCDPSEIIVKWLHEIWSALRPGGSSREPSRRSPARVIVTARSTTVENSSLKHDGFRHSIHDSPTVLFRLYRVARWRNARVVFFFSFFFFLSKYREFNRDNLYACDPRISVDFVAAILFVKLFYVK